MKKFIAFLVFFLVCAAVVFYFGWIQFAVPVDKYGVMVSKTNGVYPTVLRRGNFAWSALRLLPTNTAFYFYDIAPFTATETISGELPSAQVYSSLFAANAEAVQKPDFSYSATVRVSLGIKPESLIPLSESLFIKTQDELNTFLGQKSKEAAKLVCDALLEQKSIDDEFITRLSALPIFNGIEFSSLYVEQSRIPDMALYSIAQQSFAVYRAEVDNALSRFAEEQARSMMKATSSMEQLEKLGELLKKNPSLLELFTTGNSPADTIKAINTLLGNAE